LHAKIQSYAIYLASQLAYAAAARAASQGKAAFKSAYAAVLSNMKFSHMYRLECSLLYGRSGLGVVSSNTAGVLVLTQASFAPGIWGAGLKGSILEAFTATTESAFFRQSNSNHVRFADCFAFFKGETILANRPSGAGLDQTKLGINFFKQSA